MEGEFVPFDGSSGSTETLELRPDGTYHLHVDTHVMSSSVMDATGTYSEHDGKVELSGSTQASIDDGYGNSSSTEPHKMSLTIKDGMLAATDVKDDPFYFRKKGTGPPPIPPKLQVRRSDEAAIELARRVEAAYASLDSFSDEGTLRSSGDGFVAEESHFRIKFRRPSQLLVQAAKNDGEDLEVSWDGTTTRWYEKQYGKPNTTRPLGNALSIAQVAYGDPIALLPELLLPGVLKRRKFEDQYPTLAIGGREKLGGRDCTILLLRSKGANTTKLWIDDELSLIRKSHEDIRGSTVTYSPVRNPVLSSKDFARQH